MKKLTNPLSNTPADEIFEICVNGYSDQSKRTKLLECKPSLSEDSSRYKSLTPDHINELTLSSLPSGVTKKDLYSVYDEKFVPQNAPGRQYYSKIKSSAPGGICPMCGIRIVSTLDHYLPKSKAPTLCVTPTNLFPSCRDCNTDKRDNIAFDPCNIPVHIYFDDIPEVPWLFTNIGDHLEVSYYISCPESVEIKLRNRIEKHLEFYNLHSLYSSHAAQEIADNQALWKTLLTSNGPEVLSSMITTMRNSIESNNMNSWKAALYRGLETNLDKLIAWLSADSVDAEQA